MKEMHLLPPQTFKPNFAVALSKPVISAAVATLQPTNRIKQELEASPGAGGLLPDSKAVGQVGVNGIICCPGLIEESARCFLWARRLLSGQFGMPKLSSPPRLAPVPLAAAPCSAPLSPGHRAPAPPSPAPGPEAEPPRATAQRGTDVLGTAGARGTILGHLAKISQTECETESLIKAKQVLSCAAVTCSKQNVGLKTSAGS